MTVRTRRETEDESAVATGEFLRAVAGDASGFAAFLARFEGRIARLLRALAPPGETEDVFQEVCLRLIAKGHLFDPARPLAPWVDAVTRQVAAAAFRRRSRDSRAGSIAETEEPLAAGSASSDPFVRDVVSAHLAALPPKEREAIRLVFLSGFTQREAGARLGVPAGTVATWCARTVRALREKFRRSDST